MVTRRQVLKAAAGGAALLATGRTSQASAAGATRRAASTVRWAGTLDAAGMAKYVAPLVIPPAMPADASPDGDRDHYVIGVRQFRQQVLPPGSPATTLWGYGSPEHPESFASPAWTIEARSGRPVRCTWANQLVDGDGRYLSHLLPVDPTLHWANPPGGTHGRDTRPAFTTTPGRYRGPVPITTHLHGGCSTDDSDGHPESWFLPAARNIPSGHATEGSWYGHFMSTFASRESVQWQPGSAVFQYDNDQPASTLWYHDHTLGMTRLNVYAGLAGFYLLRGGATDLDPGVLPGPAPRAGDPPGTRYYEIPIIIQDRSFAKDGSLFYPGSRAQFSDRYGGPYIPRSHVPPIWQPEFFGDAMMVNGRTWPVLAVEPRRYRFRFLNGCNSRFLILKMAADPLAKRPVAPAVPFWQIGAEAGYLPEPVRLHSLVMGPAERADVIVDFSGVRPGTEFYLINEGPDEPFSGDAKAAPANPATTGQVMKFVLRPLSGRDESVPPALLALPALIRRGPATLTRQVALLEHAMEVRGGTEVPTASMLGTLAGGGTAKMWSDPVTENPALGAIEMWEIHNSTDDAHTVHLHEVRFEVVDRRPLKGTAARSPERWERGFKDTVIAYPKEVTRIKMMFDLEGTYVWHCHLLEHEDNEMMRPFQVGS
ncbi:multicopper oxidase [Sphaerisporangium sp. NPDC049002]|uniref:multicopper oxidase family protein n=1 Tax=unclassified Sphaerisporangium TaxID=2630420 RepID=UPI0033EE64B8